MEEKKTKVKKKQKIRVRTKYSKDMLPAVIKMNINDLYSLLPKKIIENKSKYKDLLKNLEDNGYNTDKSYIKVGEVFDRGIQILDGKKRVVLLKDFKNIKNIKVLKLNPIRKKMPNPHIKIKNMNKKINEFRQKSNNTKNS